MIWVVRSVFIILSCLWLKTGKAFAYGGACAQHQYLSQKTNCSPTDSGFNTCAINRWRDYLLCRVQEAIDEEERIIGQVNQIAQNEIAFHQKASQGDMRSHIQRKYPDVWAEYYRIMSEREAGIRNDNCFGGIVYNELEASTSNLCRVNEVRSQCLESDKAAKRAVASMDGHLAQLSSSNQSMSPVNAARKIQTEWGQLIGSLNATNALCLSGIRDGLGNCSETFKQALLFNEDLNQRLVRHCSLAGVNSNIDDFIDYISRRVTGPSKMLESAATLHIENKYKTVHVAQKFLALTNCIEKKSEDLKVFTECLADVNKMSYGGQ